MAIRCEPLEARHLDEAHALACRSYEAARLRIPELPGDAVVPRLDRFADGELGVVASEDGRVVGYIAGVPPFEGMFGYVRGTYAPLEAQAVDPDMPALERQDIWSRLYEAAAVRWVAAGALSHAVVVYADDRPAIESLFWNGCGLRTLDAMRLLEPVDPPPQSAASAGLTLAELGPDDFDRAEPLYRALMAHLRSSPALMHVRALAADQLAAHRRGRSTRIVAAARQDQLVGYIEVTDTGETFVSRWSTSVAPTSCPSTATGVSPRRCSTS
jgi:hypothetical protein